MHHQNMQSNWWENRFGFIMFILDIICFNSSKCQWPMMENVILHNDLYNNRTHMLFCGSLNLTIYYKVQINNTCFSWVKLKVNYILGETIIIDIIICQWLLWLLNMYVQSTQISEYFNNDMAKFGRVLTMEVLQEE